MSVLVFSAASEDGGARRHVDCETDTGRRRAGHVPGNDRAARDRRACAVRSPASARTMRASAAAPHSAHHCNCTCCDIVKRMADGVRASHDELLDYIEPEGASRDERLQFYARVFEHADIALSTWR